MFQQISMGIEQADFDGSDYLVLFDGGSEQADTLANLAAGWRTALTTSPKPNKPANSQYTSSNSQVVIALVTEGCHASTRFRLSWTSVGK